MTDKEPEPYDRRACVEVFIKVASYLKLNKKMYWLLFERSRNEDGNE